MLLFLRFFWYNSYKEVNKKALVVKEVQLLQKRWRLQRGLLPFPTALPAPEVRVKN